MVFTSYEFIGFFFVTLLLYCLVPKKARWVLLLVASCAFYAFSGLMNFVYIGASIAFTYLFTRLMEANARKSTDFVNAHKEDMTKEERKVYTSKFKSERKCFAAAAIIINLLLLAFCKYLNFILTGINGFLSDERKLSFVAVMVPLGISFYTLASVGYIVDVYRKTVPAEKNPFRLALFVSFFPLIIQGPISRYKDLSETLFAGNLSGNNVLRGFQRILWGFFKKLVVADRLLLAVSTLIADNKTYTGVYAIAGMILYTLELYADFTGGIDITIGVAECFGIRVTENFNRPYFAKSLKEYWRRWHISMANWFRDYVFYPVSTSGFMLKLSKALRKKGPSRIASRLPVYLSSLAVWFATGLWHGASLNFIVWGLLNYAVLMISEEFDPLYDKFHKRFSWSNTKGYRVFMMARNFLLICVLNLFDCYAHVTDTLKSFWSMVTVWNPGVLFDGSMLKLGMSGKDYIIAFAGIVVMLTVSLVQRKAPVRERIAKLPTAASYGIWLCLFISVLLFGVYGVGYDSAQFIYNRF